MSRIALPRRDFLTMAGAAVTAAAFGTGARRARRGRAAQLRFQNTSWAPSA